MKRLFGYLTSQKDEPQRASGCVTFVLLLGWLLVLNLQAFRGRESSGWSQTTGAFTRVEVIERMYHRKGQKPGFTWEVVGDYRYSVAGREYQSDRIGIGYTWLFFEQAEARALEARLQREPTVVYFDPKDPAEAVLERGVGDGMRGTLLMFVVGLGAIAGAIAFFHLRIQRRRAGEKRIVAPFLPAIAVGVGAALALAGLQYAIYAAWLS